MPVRGSVAFQPAVRGLAAARRRPSQADLPLRGFAVAVPPHPGVRATGADEGEHGRQRRQTFAPCRLRQSARPTTAARGHLPVGRTVRLDPQLPQLRRELLNRTRTRVQRTLRTPHHPTPSATPETGSEPTNIRTTLHTRQAPDPATDPRGSAGSSSSPVDESGAT